jgi:hypothetical protein
VTARFDSIADLHGSMPEIPRVASGVSTEALALLTTEPGAVIVERWLGDEMLSHVNTEIDGWFGRNTDDGPPASGSDLYDLFLGHRTLRLHGLAHKLPYTGARLSVGGWPGGCVRSRTMPPTSALRTSAMPPHRCANCSAGECTTPAAEAEEYSALSTAARREAMYDCECPAGGRAACV